MLSIFEVILIAFALSADAFSVAFGIGCKYHSVRHYFRLGWHFGLFQFLMPVLGASIGKLLLNFTLKLNIIASLILFYISYKMFKEAMKNDDEKCSLTDPTKGVSLIILSIATSMDSLGVGVSLALYKGDIFFPSFIIGAICGVVTLVGVYFGKLSRNFIGRYAEIFGAIVLTIIGIKFWVV